MEKKEVEEIKKEELSPIGYVNLYRKELMGLAALLIFVFHHWTLVTPSILPNHPTLHNYLYYIVKYLFFGVDTFFLLSGMGLVYATEGRSLSEFYSRRLKRVFLPFVISYIFFAFANGLGFFRFLQIVSGYTFYFENVYTVLWFVPAIMTLYLIFPLYDLLLRKLKYTVAITAVMILIWYVCSLIFKIRYDMYGFYNRIPIFLLGVMLGRLEKTGKFPKSRFVYLLILPFVALGAFLLYFIEKGVIIVVPASNCFLPTMLFSFAFILLFTLVMRLFHKSEKAGRFIDKFNTPLRYFGKTSLEFYLVQMFTVPGLAVITVSTSNTLADNLLLLFICTGLGFVLYTVSDLLSKHVFKIRKKEQKNKAHEQA